MIHEIKSADEVSYVRVLVVRDGDGNVSITRSVNKSDDLAECRDEIASTARRMLRLMPDGVQEDLRDSLIYSEAGIVQLARRGELDAAIEDLEGLMREYLGPASMFLVTQPLEVRLSASLVATVKSHAGACRLACDAGKKLDMPGVCDPVSAMDVLATLISSAMRRIVEVTDEGVCDGMTLGQAVDLLISQRDNAYAEIAHYKEKLHGK